VTNDRACGRPTKKGTPCTKAKHYWLEGFEILRADACWRHMDPSFREAAAQREARREAGWQAYLAADPICWHWPIPDDLENWMYPQGEDINDRLSDDALDMLMNNPESRASAILTHWQAGRCAICGRKAHLVEDHDHITGLVRGWLCRGCNTQEGTHGVADSLFGRYRERHPTKMLGLQIRYLDPFTGEYAEPVPDCAQSRAENPWLKLARPKQHDDASGLAARLHPEEEK
jgi:hypothetical protein